MELEKGLLEVSLGSIGKCSTYLKTGNDAGDENKERQGHRVFIEDIMHDMNA